MVDASQAEVSVARVGDHFVAGEVAELGLALPGHLQVAAEALVLVGQVVGVDLGGAGGLGQRLDVERLQAQVLQEFHVVEHADRFVVGEDQRVAFVAVLLEQLLLQLDEVIQRQRVDVLLGHGRDQQLGARVLWHDDHQRALGAGVYAAAAARHRRIVVAGRQQVHVHRVRPRSLHRDSCKKANRSNRLDMYFKSSNEFGYDLMILFHYERYVDHCGRVRGVTN